MLKTYSYDSEESSKVAKHRTAVCLDELGFQTYFDKPQAIGTNANGNGDLISFYNPKEYFQTYVKSAVRAAKKVDFILILGTSWRPVILFPRTDEIWLDADEEDIKDFAEKLITRADGIAGFTLKPAEAELDLSHALHRFHNADALLWKLACWASKGRYPKSIDFKMPFYLKTWPNFPRLLVTPHALRIATLLIGGARTMVNIAETLKVHPQYVFIFISSAYTVGLVGQATRTSDLLVEPPGIKPHKSRSLFKLIIKKLNNSET